MTRIRVHHSLLAAGIWTLIGCVALLDFWTPAALIGAILFTLPLGLCALHGSKRLLWSVAEVAVLLTMAAELWGFGRGHLSTSWPAMISRSLLVVSLGTLTTFIHLWLNKQQTLAAQVAQIRRQSETLASQNAQLARLVAAANRDSGTIAEAEKHVARLEDRAQELLEAAPDAEKQLTQLEVRRRLTEDALRESEERYRMLIDGVHDHAIFMMDARGQIISWNAGAERIKGYRADEIVGKNFACFFPAEDIERGRPEEVLRLTALSGRHEEQGMRVRKDGSRFLAGLTFTALCDSAGNLRGFSEFSRDLSESKEAGAKYRGLLEAAPDAMIVVNQLGQIVLLNLQAEKQLGYYRDELVGQAVTNIIPTGFAERLIADGNRTAAEALAQHIGTGIELLARRKDGSQFPIELMLSPLENTEGILVTAAIRDISVRKAAAKHLAQMEGRYRGLLEAAPDAMVLLDHAGGIVLVNLQAEKQFGYRRDELVGKQVKQIIPDEVVGRLLTSVLQSSDPAAFRRAPDARLRPGGLGLLGALGVSPTGSVDHRKVRQSRRLARPVQLARPMTRAPLR